MNQIDNFKELSELRKKYKYFLSYDSIMNADSLERDFWNSAIRFYFCRYTNKQENKFEILEKYVLFHQESIHSENLEYIEKLWNMFKNKTKYKKILKNLDFYILAGKYRAIINFINLNKIDGFITSDPTIPEKLERINVEIKRNAYSSKDFKSFKQIHKEIKSELIN